MESPASLQRIVIVGAGPCGVLLALSLLQRARASARGEESYNVTILERRPDPRSSPPSSRRTYPISLQKRGLDAIRDVPGLLNALEKERGVWQVGSVMHRKNGRGRMNDRKEAGLMMDRNDIVACMLDHLESSTRDYEESEGDGGRFELSLRFGCSFGGFDEGEGEEKAIRVEPVSTEGGGQSSSVPYDRLVAADGSGSAVRAALVSMGKMKCEENFIPDNYRTLFVPMTQRPVGKEKEPHHLASDRVHTWLLSNGNKMILCPNGAGYLHGVVIFEPDKDPIVECTNADAVMEYFKAECPLTVGKLITPEEAEAVRTSGVHRTLTVRCDRMAVGTDVLLLGDAAHAVSASVGQGCNSALGDVSALCRELDAAVNDWDRAVPAFSARRLPEAHALRDLSDYSMPRTKLMWAEFIFRVTVGKWIRRWCPWLLGPLPMELIMNGDMPYTDVLRLTSGWINRVRKSVTQMK